MGKIKSQGKEEGQERNSCSRDRPAITPYRARSLGKDYEGEGVNYELGEPDGDSLAGLRYLLNRRTVGGVSLLYLRGARARARGPGRNEDPDHGKRLPEYSVIIYE